ncbi:MAG: UTP--glucose-1-phosphate uridylyltransferase, partial [Eubacterium sp.]|nr:UTP--glucose-1-phosphate uridylyltransferase [Eubacterium sp.]
LKEIGINAIKEGKTAALLLAGGMGTRLGSDNPKGMYNIGITKEVFIFQRIIENLLDVVNEAGATPRLFIMTSDKNNDATIAFLKEKNYFGYPADRVNFFKQDMAPACDYNGKLYMEGKGKLATSPNGNAGWYSSMIKAGLDKIIEDEGIEWVNVFAVDNVLQRICDPAFVGATIDAGVEVGAKVVKKAAPDEKVGVICLEDGRPSIVEYYELSQEMMDAKDDKGDPAYNFGVILNYLFKVSALNRIAKEQTMLHVVEKKIPYIDESGELVKPTEPNGYKFEQLVLDLIHMLDSCLSYEVIRENEFAPIKNATGVDSVESARELCKKNGIEL